MTTKFDLLISILITYHNEKELLTECLDSLFGDIPDNVELLIYDDASEYPAQNYVRDKTVQIIRSEKKLGPGYGRNRLMSSAAGEYIHCHDADDLFAPGWFDEVSEVIADKHPDIILTEVKSTRNREVVSQNVMDYSRLNPDGDLVSFALGGSILVPSTTYKREIALQIGGYRTWDILPQSEDFDFHVRLAHAAKSYVVIPEPLIIQRLRDNSHSSMNLVSCYSSALKAVELLEEELPFKYQDDLAKAASRCGTKLFLFGERKSAKKAFALSKRLGKTDFQGRGPIYGLLAITIGQYAAELIAAYYRRCFPVFLRQLLNSGNDSFAKEH
jgi:glycosyltransferase involved in cell wall biosynthesis